MKTEESSAVGARRWFLRSAGAVGLAGALPRIAAAQTCLPKDRIELFAEGIVPLSHLLSVAPVPIPADVQQALLAGTQQLRLRMTTQNSGTSLAVQLYLAIPGTPLPQPLTPNRFGPPTVSLFIASITDTLMAGNLQSHNFAIRGKITSNTVRTWFGNLTGAVIAFGGGYDHIGNARFTLLGGSVPGSHTVFAPAGLGRTYNYFYA